MNSALRFASAQLAHKLFLDYSDAVAIDGNRWTTNRHRRLGTLPVAFTDAIGLGVELTRLTSYGLPRL